MDSLLEFAKGPLFRFSFAVMILGLIRVFILSLINGFEAKSKAKDKVIPKNFVTKLTLGFILPIRAFRVKPVYSFISILFHIGLLLTPILLFDHALLFDNSIGFSWLNISLSGTIASNLTLFTISAGILLIILRISDKKSRFISRKQDFLWPLLLLVPFITGYVCGNVVISPLTYKTFLTIHILSGDLIFILIPLTKIAHCVLLPISQWITARAWKFVPEAGENIEKILGKEGQKL
ncbi:MAG: nitrate reductase [Ignavibacteria bacterium]|nr:nitrate reductase [Ignavibacteria bacterium]